MDDMMMNTITLADTNDDEACELPELTEEDLASVTGGCALCGCGTACGPGMTGGLGQPPFYRQF